MVKLGNINFSDYDSDKEDNNFLSIYTNSEDISESNTSKEIFLKKKESNNDL